MAKRNGFDRYLEYQYNQSGDFYMALWHAIQFADTKNTARLAMGFPEEVEAYRIWTRVGVQEFVKHVSPDHGLLSRFKDEYATEIV